MATIIDGKELAKNVREGLKEESIDYLGYVIEPKYLFSHVIKLIETGEFDVEYMEKIIKVIWKKCL